MLNCLLFVSFIPITTKRNPKDSTAHGVPTYSRDQWYVRYCCRSLNFRTLCRVLGLVSACKFNVDTYAQHTHTKCGLLYWCWCWFCFNLRPCAVGVVLVGFGLAGLIICGFQTHESSFWGSTVMEARVQPSTYFSRVFLSISLVT